MLLHCALFSHSNGIFHCALFSHSNGICVKGAYFMHIKIMEFLLNLHSLLPLFSVPSKAEQGWTHDGSRWLVGKVWAPVMNSMVWSKNTNKHECHWQIINWIKEKEVNIRNRRFNHYKSYKSLWMLQYLKESSISHEWNIIFSIFLWLVSDNFFIIAFWN